MFRTVAAGMPPALARLVGRPAALFFHGVEKEISDQELQFNHHTLERFHAIASALKVHFDVAPIGDLAHVLKNPQKHARTVFLMADDGYTNNLNIAADVLEDVGLPWTLFVSTKHIDTGERNPMFVARLFLNIAPDGAYQIAHLGADIRLSKSRQAVTSAVFRELRNLPGEKASEAVDAMLAVLAKLGLLRKVLEYQSEAFLDWDGVRELARRGVTIGAHAHYHWALHAGESPEFLKQQAELPKARIEAEIGRTCHHFAYPFGNDTDICAAAWRAVRDAGYEYGFTTMSGALGSGLNSWLLPRYGLEPREPNLAATVPLLRLGNRRMARWQAALG